MQLQGNTVLITGGGSGIGRGLAEALHRRGNKVIIAGRRLAPLEDVVAANPGMACEVLDIQDPHNIEAVAATLVRKYPDLNVLLNNAGVMSDEDLLAGDTKAAVQTIEINLLGPIRLSAALLPHLLTRPRATILTVSSGVAFLTLAVTPTYCATKAAIHSYSQSLRYQLKDTNVQVIELVPPYVRTPLQGEWQLDDPRAMPLDAFIDETMSLLEQNPEAHEICVERVQAARTADRGGDYDSRFITYNDAVFAARRAQRATA
jgi:uncharacterized oxidoreductase